METLAPKRSIPLSPGPLYLPLAQAEGVPWVRVAQICLVAALSPWPVGRAGLGRADAGSWVPPRPLYQLWDMRRENETADSGAPADGAAELLPSPGGPPGFAAIPAPALKDNRRGSPLVTVSHHRDPVTPANVGRADGLRTVGLGLLPGLTAVTAARRASQCSSSGQGLLQDLPRCEQGPGPCSQMVPSWCCLGSREGLVDTARPGVLGENARTGPQEEG